MPGNSAATVVRYNRTSGSSTAPQWTPQAAENNIANSK